MERLEFFDRKVNRGKNSTNKNPKGYSKVDFS